MAPLDIPERHRRKIARDTLRLHCPGCLILGGMTHPEAARLLGRPVPAGCDCSAREGYAAARRNKRQR